MNLIDVKYRDLPMLPSGLRTAWTADTPLDDLGTVRRITSETVRAAAAQDVQYGERVCLSLPMNEPHPPYFGRKPFEHVIFDFNELVQDDYVNGFFLQASSQWDGLRHRKDPDVGFYGGVSDAEAGPGGSRLGVEHWATEGIIGRGVLVDVAHGQSPSFGTEARAIGVEDLRRTMRRQDVRLQRGDILLVRTGYLQALADADDETRARIRDDGSFTGLVPDEEMAEFLWDEGVAAVAADNPGVEVFPRDPNRPTLHARLLPLLGFAMGELFALDELAAACARRAKYSFMFVSVPLHIRGAVGSPSNAVAIL
ncbi:cyclase family protein [Dactylosporangium roseum]|uniref:Cyclase family protein n=1 Tax=Dactylosporangium roseum TaxID=47989 RepID=A0ABY5YYJ9_9ACTN|nr:cyclase family protein [Dactylosporangium roseum]UWZ34474.1 cyclase family protein [Dactylosporangium roseum]